jgi:hypothetical protein
MQIQGIFAEHPTKPGGQEKPLEIRTALQTLMTELTLSEFLVKVQFSVGPPH